MVSMPKRNRYGATTTTLPDGQYFDNGKAYKGHDDLFSLFDGIAWKGDRMRFIQWTQKSQISIRINKIEDFLEEHDVKTPSCATIEIWGYTDRKGFTRIEKI